VLAKNRIVKRNGRKLYFRRYPQGRLAVHVVGYSTVSRARAGLEKSLNGVLTGTERNLGGLVERQLDEARGKPIVGDTVVTTLDLHGQQVALQQLGRTCGAVAAIDPRDGRLLVMASSPSYNPNLVENDFGASRRSRPLSPLPLRSSTAPPRACTRRARRSRSSRRRRHSSRTASRRVRVRRPGYCIAYGKRVNNFDTSRPFGRLSLATALKYSVNSVFCNMGKALGAKRIPRPGEEVRLLRAPPARDAGRRALPERALRQGRALVSEAELGRRRRTDGVRPGAHARDAAPDGDGRPGQSATPGS
jgi:peptidoglycan glycosyltransferase